MKAIVYEKYGSPDVLEAEEVYRLQPSTYGGNGLVTGSNDASV